MILSKPQVSSTVQRHQNNTIYCADMLNASGEPSEHVHLKLRSSRLDHSIVKNQVIRLLPNICSHCSQTHLLRQNLLHRVHISTTAQNTVQQMSLEQRRPQAHKHKSICTISLSLQLQKISIITTVICRQNGRGEHEILKIR